MLISLLIYALALLATIAGARLIIAGWRALYKRMASKNRTRIDTMIFQETERPFFFLLLLFGWYIATRFIYHQPYIVESYAWKLVHHAFFILATVATARTILALIRASLRWYQEESARKADANLNVFVNVVNNLVQIVVYFLAGTVVLARFGITITSLLATAGVASLAVALAAQETLGNMLAGLSIMLDRPFRMGDRVELADGTTGDVTEIGLRSTKVLSFDNTLIVIPNRDIAGARIVNHNYPDPKVKVRITIGVSFDSDMARVKQVLEEILNAHPRVLKDPPVATYFTGFGESALHVLAIGWINDYHDKVAVLDELNMEIKRRFEEEGIEIPYPQRILHLANDEHSY